MFERDSRRPAMRPGGGRCTVLTVADRSEADGIRQFVDELNSACLVTYEGIRSFVMHCPESDVANVVLASGESPDAMGLVLHWLRNRWPRCAVTVVADVGGGIEERVARSGGANFLTRPVGEAQWRAVLGLRQNVAADRQDD